MNRRSFFTWLAAPFVARFAPKPKLKEWTPEDFSRWFEATHGEAMRQMANLVDEMIMESMVYGTGFIRIDDFQTRTPSRIGSDWTDSPRVKITEYWPRENPSLHFMKPIEKPWD